MRDPDPGLEKFMDPDPVCPKRLDPDPNPSDNAKRSFAFAHLASNSRGVQRDISPTLGVTLKVICATPNCEIPKPHIFSP